MTIIAYQLYCSRNFPPLEDTLAMLAQAGYLAVEGYGGLYEDAGSLRDALDRHGLSMPSGHFALEAVEADAQGAIATARRLGIAKVFVPWIAPAARGTDLAGWRALASRVATALAPLRDAGLTCGWHNHDFDLVDLGGTTPTDLMAEAGLAIELDLGWVHAAGLDPATTIRRLAPSIAAVHVKDRAPDGTTAEDGWTDVGHGTIDWAPVRQALADAGVDHWVIEHDNPSDHARFARASLHTVQGW